MKFVNLCLLVGLFTSGSVFAKPGGGDIGSSTDLSSTALYESIECVGDYHRISLQLPIKNNPHPAFLYVYGPYGQKPLQLYVAQFSTAGIDLSELSTVTTGTPLTALQVLPKGKSAKVNLVIAGQLEEYGFCVRTTAE